VIWL